MASSCETAVNELAPPEFRLLVACAKAAVGQGDAASVRRILQGSLDWAAFAHRAAEHDLAIAAGRTLLSLAPEHIPEDIRAAFRTIVGEARAKNLARLQDLGIVCEALASSGIDAIPLDGPAFALRAHADLAVRVFDRMGILVPECDAHRAASVVEALGYEEIDKPNPVSRERSYSKSGYWLHLDTGLAPDRLGVRIDSLSLWRQAGREDTAGQPMLRLAPEDEFARFAIAGGRWVASNLAWAWDLAALIAAHPAIDWAALVRRARTEGWLRMLVLAARQVPRHLFGGVPDALVDAARSLAGDPASVHAWRRLGQRYFDLGRYNESVACYDMSLAIEPDSLRSWHSRTSALRALGRSAGWGVPADSNDADGWALRAGFLWASGRLDEAARESDRALALDPEHLGAARIGVHCRLYCCDWSRREEDKRRITEGLAAGKLIVKVMDHRNLCDSEAELRESSRLAARSARPPEGPLSRFAARRHEKIRIAYVSPDFRTHPVASLIVGCIESHDRSRFETTGISFGADDRSDLRRRIEAAFDRFIDVQTVNDTTTAQSLREREIDIAIDLCGHAGGSRIGILACRAAPVQVNYLGYPGTTDAPFIDYIIADRCVIPARNAVHYSESIVYLPHCYLPTDRRRLIAEPPPSRDEAGLPERGFVYACFNSPHKIGPEIFGVWMRLLEAVAGSVLWLPAASAAVISNLRGEACARGIAGDRLIFAPRVPRDAEHLARLSLADLFLDTLPYNAHASACDALWAGLPVLTCLGNAFAGRVAASALRAAGIPELVVESLAEYEELARTLAQVPDRLASIRSQLRSKRETSALFDTTRYTRNFEAALEEMWERQQAGLPPASFAVAELGS